MKNILYTLYYKNILKYNIKKKIIFIKIKKIV